MQCNPHIIEIMAIENIISIGLQAAVQVVRGVDRRSAADVLTIRNDGHFAVFVGAQMAHFNNRTC